MDFKEEVLKYHKGEDRHGKIGTEILTSVDGKKDLSMAYTPGVALPCLEIEKDKNKVYDYTSKGNTVAVISNGTAVLGLGNIGAMAGKPVMEGKALLFKYFGGIDAVDVEINSQKTDEIVKTIELISGTYGGINLEDFKAPECFEIERMLKSKLDIPVFHDDQHGTAIVVGAGILNALRVAEKKIEDISVVINGAGAAGIAIGKMLLSLGVSKENLMMCDSKGVVYAGRDAHESKKFFAVETEKRTLSEAVKDSDVFIGVSKAGLLSADMLSSMNKNPVVFAMANPNPEIDWEEAHKTRGDVIMATGRSDFPNQVNNVLAFPGIFRGALDSRAREINEDMKIAAVKALAKLVEVPTADKIITDPFNKKIIIEVAFSVAESAVNSEVASGSFVLEGYREKLIKRFEND